MEEITKELKDIKETLDKLMQISTQVVKKKIMFYDFIEEWFMLYKKPFLKIKSLNNIKTVVQLHIKPYICDMWLEDIKMYDIQKCLAYCKQSRTREDCYIILNNLFCKAMELEYILHNPFNGIKIKKHQRINGNALTHEEEEQFLQIIKTTKHQNVFKFYLYSGLRKSELLSIKTRDIDFKNKCININGTKTKTSKRQLPLFDNLKQIILHEYKQNNEYLFNVTNNAITCSFKRLKDKYNLQYTLHSLRHTFATRCLQKSINIKTVQKWLGHSKLETTATIYSHIQNDFEQMEIEKMNKTCF